MKKPLLIFGLVVIIFSNLKAQESYLLIDHHSNEPVPFAHVKHYKDNWGTTSNSDGKWQNVFSENDTIIISAIGFKSRKVALADLQYDTIRLQQSFTKLPEILISGLTAKEIVKKSVAEVPEVYSQQVNLSGIYFSATRENESFVHYLKSGCQIDDPDYLKGKIEIIKKIFTQLAVHFWPLNGKLQNFIPHMILRIIPANRPSFL